MAEVQELQEQIAALAPSVAEAALTATLPGLCG
jgi:hypothetical protein